MKNRKVKTNLTKLNKKKVLKKIKIIKCLIGFIKKEFKKLW